MILRLIIILLLFLGVSLNTHSQAVIKGRVYDKNSLKPLVAATVIYGKETGTVTGREGDFLIQTLPGKISLSFRYVGYKTQTRNVIALADDTLFLEIGMEHEISEIDQIVVSAGKVEQRVSELTVSLNVIKPEILSNSHMTDPTELLNKIPGIEVLDGQASIRGGSGFSYGAGSRLLALIDGLPVLAADAGNIKWQFLPLENISQIEIIKGASSVLYGSSALNGVINFRTADAGDEPESKFFVETGVFGKPENKNWIWWDAPRTFYSTSFSHLSKIGNTDIANSIYLLYDNGYRKFNEKKLGRANIRIKHRDNKISGLSYGMNLNAGVNQKTDFVLWDNATTGALIQDTATAEKLNGRLVTIDPFISLDRNGKFRHDLRTRFQNSQNEFPDAGENDSEAFSFLADYKLFYRVMNWMNLTLGAFENYSKITSSFYGNHNTLNLAAYSQVDILPVPRLKMTGGVRLEYNSLDKERGSLIPLFRAGINYRLENYTFLRASFGQGYRYPSIAEKFAATTLGSVRIVPNPDVLPESGWSAEAGIKQGIAFERVTGFLDIAFFYSRNSDMIEYLFGIYPVDDGSSFSYGFKATNIENSKVFGTEISFSLKREGRFFHHTLNGGYNYIYPVEIDDVGNEGSEEFLKYRRKHSVKFGYSGKFRNWGWGFDLVTASKILRIDEVFLNELTRESLLPGFFDYWNTSNAPFLVIDPHLQYNFGPQYRLSFVIKNVFNTEYMGRPGDMMPHRNFSLRFSGNF